MDANNVNSITLQSPILDQRRFESAPSVGADSNFMGNSLEDSKPLGRFGIFNGINSSVQLTQQNQTNSITQNTPTTDINLHNPGVLEVNDWTEKIDDILEILLSLCDYLSKFHIIKYQIYKSRLNYFRIPIIVLSAINGFTAIGLQEYVAQSNISIINSFLSLLCGIITSIELFLNIQKRMENYLTAHKEFNLLSLEIYKTINLERQQRNGNGKAFLDETFAEFKKLIQSSNPIDAENMVDIGIRGIEGIIKDNKNVKEQKENILEKIRRNSVTLYKNIGEEALQFYNSKKYKIHKLKEKSESHISGVLEKKNASFQKEKSKDSRDDTKVNIMTSIQESDEDDNFIKV